MKKTVGSVGLALVLGSCAAGPAPTLGPGAAGALVGAGVAVNGAAVVLSPSLAKAEAALRAKFSAACGSQIVIAAQTIVQLAGALIASGKYGDLANAASGLAAQGCAMALAPASNGVGLLDRATPPMLLGVELKWKRIR